jgi:glycine/D-amino acid oxidase-like deaminating enzyme
MSIISLAGGFAAGAAATWGLARGISRFARDKDRLPELYEYFVDNFWFKAAGLENEKLNEPLRGKHKADVVIIGGGYTGLSSAYNLSRRFPEKKIVLLEGACCGYGASGRNGGFLEVTSLIDHDRKDNPDAFQQSMEVSFYGQKQIKELFSEHGLDCDYQQTGRLEVGFDEKHTRYLEDRYEHFKEIGLEPTLLQGKELEAEVNSPRCILGVKHAHGGFINPAKLARGLKPIVESLGVEVRERTPVLRVTFGKTHRIETELGETEAPDVVIGTNAYSHKIGIFKNRVFPICAYVIATEPLSKSQWESIGWQNRQGLGDVRPNFNYMVPTKDGRIVIGGSAYAVHPNDGLPTGNNKSIARKIEEDLFETFPQLEGLGIDHAWGGPIGHSIDFVPSVGVMGEHGNIYYGVGYNEGVPEANTAGRMITDLMAGEKNEFTSHYIVNRKIPWAGPQFVRSAGFRVAFGLTRRFMKTTFYK